VNTIHNNLLLDQALQEKLNDRIQHGLYRKLNVYEDKIDFCSNDYLGFSKILSSENAQHIYIQNGATGSRLISGNSFLAEQTEQLIADFHGKESALIFNSGYSANLGLLSCLAQKGDTYIVDEYIHASIMDGARLSYANKYKFKHNNVVDLEKKLATAQGKKFVVVESIYSMDGDEAPLEAIVNVCEKYQAYLIVDEAHATGLYGPKGEGIVAANNLQDKVYAIIYTFGKALGLHGAAIVCNQILKEYLINFSRPFIYTTALPPSLYIQLQKAYQLLPQLDRKILFDLIYYFKQQLSQTTFKFIESQSQIQGLIVGNSKQAHELSNYLLQKGIYAKSIVSPTVAIGSERLRICLHMFNTKTDIDLLVQEINNFTK
jgi:8-amino-7-oxononanoate synthase